MAACSGSGSQCRHFSGFRAWATISKVIPSLSLLSPSVSGLFFPHEFCLPRCSGPHRHLLYMWEQMINMRANLPIPEEQLQIQAPERVVLPSAPAGVAECSPSHRLCCSWHGCHQWDMHLRQGHGGRILDVGRLREEEKEKCFHFLSFLL